MRSSTSTKPDQNGHIVPMFIPWHDRSTEEIIKKLMRKRGGRNRSKFLRQLVREDYERSTESRMS